MSLRESFTESLKASMRASDAPRTSSLRMILAKLKDADIASRPKGIPLIPDDEITAMLRGMVKQRRESVQLYIQGNRQELADKELAESADVPKKFLEAILTQLRDEGLVESRRGPAGGHRLTAAPHRGLGYHPALCETPQTDSRRPVP